MKLMKRNLPSHKIFSSIAVLFLMVGFAFAQTSAQKIRRNSPFAPNPKGRAEIAKASNSDLRSSAAQNNFSIESNHGNNSSEDAGNKEPVAESAPDTQSAPDAVAPKNENIAAENSAPPKKELEVARLAAANALPAEIYKVGSGDVLFIGLQNAPSKESTYFTVLKDGTIDYPLAGEMVAVAGLTTDEIKATLEEKIKLYENPEISVKVREHNSHSYTVLGAVEKPGEKFLQREAYPLMIVKAEAIIKQTAARAVIKRSDAQMETIDLKDDKADSVLIFPGDTVEFSEVEPVETPKQFFYIGGEIASGGQKDFLAGMTLTQAVLASGGLKKTSVKKVVIRRRNEAGMLVPNNYDLKAIKDGKIADPEIKAGDTIEIGN